jgi:copper(I)-binding protein
LIPTLLSSVVLTSCLAGTAWAATPLSASHAWIRWLPGDLPLAGYVTLENHGKKSVKLVSAHSKAFKRIELHHSMENEGMSEMKKVNAVSVPAHGAFSFKPGGYHLMMWRGAKLKPGDKVPVTLKFAGGDTLRVVFTLKGVAG